MPIDNRPITEIKIVTPRNPEGKTGFFRLQRNSAVVTGGRFFFSDLWEQIRKERRAGRRVVFIRRATP